MQKALIKAALAVAAAILIIVGTLLLLVWQATPPEVPVGGQFSDYSEKLGAPSSVFIDQDAGTAKLQYVYGFLLVAEMLQIEVAPDGIILSVKQDSMY